MGQAKHKKYSVETICGTCGKPICIKKVYSGRTRFCSKDCANQFHSQRMKNEGNPAWQGGIQYAPYSYEFDHERKLTVKERDNFTCQICGKRQWELNYPLSVHHIDYDKKNHALENLIALCSACHCKTNYNRNLWIERLSKKLAESSLCRMLSTT
jgi:hypothetical protein